MLKPGDVVFFKEVTRTPGRRERKIGFKGGHGFAVMLGIVPPGGRPPVEANLMMLMGAAGYMSFDDVANFLGEETGKKCVAMFEDKYYPKPKKIEVVGADGKPVVNGKDKSPLILVPGKH